VRNSLCRFFHSYIVRSEATAAGKPNAVRPRCNMKRAARRYIHILQEAENGVHVELLSVSIESAQCCN